MLKKMQYSLKRHLTAESNNDVNNIICKTFRSNLCIYKSDLRNTKPQKPLSKAKYFLPRISIKQKTEIPKKQKSPTERHVFDQGLLWRT